jgi:hypothetical protein
MDWMLSNEAEQAQAGRFGERARPVQPQWRQQFVDPRRPSLGFTKGGYPVEIMVALANEARAHPHFNMPYKFDDEYVREFAKIVHDKLAPGLVATVEYSNEVWNWGFAQASYARNQAEKLWPGEKSGWVQFMGARASAMCRIWKQVFARDRERLRCVIAPQTGWPDIASASLDCPRWVAMGHEPCYKAADAVAITGYVSGHLQEPENTELVKRWLAKGKDYALAQAFRQLESGGVDGVKSGDHAASGDDASSVKNAIAAFQRFRRIAQQRGLGLYVYEGGTHFNHGSDPVLKSFLVDVTRDRRMTALYLELFEGFRMAGGTVFNVWGGMGEDSVWANADNLGDRTHPKYRAVVEFVAHGGRAP